MRILVVGGGGREHALAWRFTQDGHEVCACPGNPGIQTVGECILETPEDAFRRIEPDLVVVGPEDPLVDGIADRLRALGATVFGPGADGARLEASKAFSKQLMVEAGVPTAVAGTFFEPRSASDYARTRFDVGRKVVVKASGNALGKGVVLCDSIDETNDVLREMMVDKSFGDAGETVVIEDRLFGPEFSLLAVVNGRDFVSLPVAQDYKRIGDGDVGPNTGGMGTYSPVAAIREEWVAQAEEQVVAPIIHALGEKGIDYRGVLFAGLMVHEDKPMCLEYNVRFGDPETQTVVRRIGPGLAELLLSAAQGGALSPLENQVPAAVTVMLASKGYPTTSKKGDQITIGDLPEEVVLFHSGTALRDDVLVTNGGRVLGVSATGATVADARRTAYEAVGQIVFDGMQFRSDIAGT
ncbi:MAG: phosphoribosylamine--glycine ligase [Fimbriimonadaceae bacterium]|nr:phosphoribosylamine--glycine ligase [Fimbriimonadaceae bacterium]